ncbi:uncharacterized protein LOC107431398 isoform X2 [Ziziphus jujuba]|uniref:Uncharacterized protein LOC107431398 isoform X2 n=1 Tax=Ziziphus jujuba TaxID=326968 RepID=A0A6P4B6M9_ZIZJJ|nr:uncharacterized protein LOC107431398 isoform X2 [Ziziphus jujuba]
MGGGGAMRAAAAKVAGFTGALQGGFRGSAAVPPVEQSVRKVSVPVSASISSSQSVNSAVSSDVAASAQKPAWEINDWELAGVGEDELLMAKPMPRVVFGAVPTFQEAKEATVELKDALDHSPKSCGSAENDTTDEVAGMSLFSNGDSETKSCLIVETKPKDSIPTQALQAFRYLSASTEVQNVVASIASDPNMWNAMLQNSELKQFIASQQTEPTSIAVDELQEDPVSFKKMEDEMTDSSQCGKTESGFMNILQNIKVKVMDMVSNVSSFLNRIFELPPDVNGDTKSTGIDRTLGSTFMGLSVLVIMVVLLKRV